MRLSFVLLLFLGYVSCNQWNSGSYVEHVLGRKNNINVSPCSEANRRHDLQGCLTAIRSDLLDRNKYWFGSGYKANCPRGVATNVECTNPWPERADNLWSRTFRDSVEKFDVSSIDRYLKVTYTSQKGDYPACGNKYEVLNDRRFSVDATSSQTYSTFEVLSQPEFKWPYKAGEYYTLILFNTGMIVNLGVYINIQKNDIKHAEVILPYQSINNPFKRTNPNLFLLFKQRGYLTIDEQSRKKLGEARLFRKSPFLGDVISALKLRGPVAVNKLMIHRSPFSIQDCFNQMLINQCPALDTDALSTEKLRFVPKDVDLVVSVNVTYQSTDWRYTKGRFTKKEKEIFLNPLGNGHLSAREIQSRPDVNLIRRTPWRNILNFKGICYTLVLVKPSDGQYANYPNLDWMVVNIRRGNLTRGQDVLEYIAPKADPHGPKNYFLLYQQDGTHDISVELYPKYCKRFGHIRCRFDINRFVKDYQMTLVGASWMTVSRYY